LRRSRPRLQATGPAPAAGRGRRTGSRPWRPRDSASPLDFGRTINAALARQAGAVRPGQKLSLAPEDRHKQVRSRRTRRLIVFVVDTSDSMADGPTARIAAALGASLSLAAAAYLNRDQVCLITFRDREARVVVPPTDSVMRVRQELQRLPVGGATPLAAGLQKAGEVIRQSRFKDPGLEPLLVLISDGEATVPLSRGADPVKEALALAGLLRQEKIRALVVDTLESHQPGNLMPQLAEALGADCRQIRELHTGSVMQLIEQAGNPRSL